MKKTIFLIIIFTVLAGAYVSAFGKKENKPSEFESENNSKSASEFQQVPASPKQLKESSSEEAEITGLVERGFENRISIVINPRSKSRVSYYPDEKASKKLEKKLGQTVTVTGIVKNTENPFKKEIEISEIK